MARKVGIIAYGSPEDRLRIEALARVEKTSASAWIIERIKAEFKQTFGEVAPKEVAHAR